MTTKIKDIAFKFIDGLTNAGGELYLSLAKKSDEKQMIKEDRMYQFNRKEATALAARVRYLERQNKDSFLQAELRHTKSLGRELKRVRANVLLDRSRKELRNLERSKLKGGYLDVADQIGRMKALEYFICEVMN